MPVSDSRPGVYISWPFCAQKCSYCNFASGVFPPDLERAYAGALTREIGEFEWPAPPDTVYLGGGTPSQMPLADLARILIAIPGRPWREATIEAAPGSITVEAAAAWAALGIDRVSLGVQSFVSRELARTGRKHTADTVARDVEVLRATGIRNVNIDLIAGLPGQTDESWAQSLDWVERLETPHASVYMLEVDEDSRLGREILFHGIRYGATDVPTDDAIAHMYETAVERVWRRGNQPVRDLELRTAWGRVRPQSEILAASAVHRFWRRCSLVRWGVAQAECGDASGLCRARVARRIAGLFARAGQSERGTIFRGPPAEPGYSIFHPRSGPVTMRRSRAFWPRGCSSGAMTFCG